jgi:ABC-type transport system involved in multi-copper enzyme maturation permease subunit
VFRLTWSGLLAWRRAPGVLVLVFANPVLVGLAVGGAAVEHRNEGFEMWILNLYAAFMVPLACLMSGGSMVRDELQAGTLGFLLTRPLHRARLLLLKYACHTFWLELTLGLNAVLLSLAGHLLGIEGALLIGLWLLGVQTLVIPAFTALSAVLGLASKRYVLLGILYGFIVEMGIGQIPTNINTLSLTRHFQALMGQCPALEATVALSSWGIPGAILAVVGLTVAGLAVAAALFSLREFLEAEPPR